MRNVLMLVVVVCTIIMGSSSSHAQQLLESYQAFLSERDHFNSSGQRLTTAAAIIRQDRANFHRFGLRDAGDESDSFFSIADNRAALERMLEHGRAEPGVISRIVNGTPLVRVEVWQGGAGPFVVVTLIEPSRIKTEEPQGTQLTPPSTGHIAADETIPRFNVSIEFSPSALQKLVTNQESVHISTVYYGNSRSDSDSEFPDDISLGTEDVDILPGNIARLGGTPVDRNDVERIFDRKPMLFVNVYSSRKVFKDNILDCGAFQDPIDLAARDGVVMTCKLIGER